MPNDPTTLQQLADELRAEAEVKRIHGVANANFADGLEEAADRIEKLLETQCDVAAEACAEYADGTCLTHYKNEAFHVEQPIQWGKFSKPVTSPVATQDSNEGAE